MPFVTAEALRLYYEIRGSGRPILFIGGTGADLRQPANPFQRRLTGDFEVLLFDQRGLGQSDKPEPPYSMADYAADANGLMEALAWPPCPVLGYSFGGMVAQELALRHPARVERLVLLSTTSGGAGGSSYPLHELAHLPPPDRARRMVELSDVRRDAAWQERNRDLHAALVEDSLAAMLTGAGEPGHDIGMHGQLGARRYHDTWERLPSLSAPVFVFGGKYDGLAPPQCQQALARRIPGARFELFEGGHLFFLQDGRAYERIHAALIGEV